MKPRILRVAAPLLLASALSAQLQEAWVDPINGDDSTGMIGVPTQPFRTIWFALQIVAPVAGPGSPAIIRCEKGIYSATTNFEQFPLLMRDYVNVVGCGARQCVLRGGPSGGTFNLFYPTLPSGGRAPRRPLVDFTFLTDTSYTEALDGFTLQDGDVQVYCETESERKAFRVSNCVFDMVDANGGGPAFGVLLVQTWNFSASRFDPIDAHLLNNTFIQAAIESGVVTPALFDAVAVCSTTEDPVGFRSLRGETDLNVQNNLIRCAGGSAARTAFLGVDANDTTATLGTTTGPTNAFSPGLSGGNSVGGTYRSVLVNGQGAPVPKVALLPNGTVDPNFLGETDAMLFGTPVTARRDWRLRPTTNTNPLENQGTNPGGSGGIVRSAANLSYVELPPAFAFATDMDGNGNPRVVGEVDIGADEIGLFTVSGCFSNGTVSYHRAANCYLPHPLADINRRYTFRQPLNNPLLLLVQNLTWAPCLPGITPGGCNQPGTIDPGIPAAGFAPPWSTVYLDPVWPNFASTDLTSLATTQNYVNPVDSAAYSFTAIWMAPGGDFGNGVFLNEQWVTIELASTGTVYRLTNLQSEIY